MPDDEHTSKFGSAGDLFVAGAASILGLFPLTAPIGAMGSVGLLAWQSEQQRKFTEEVRRRLQSLDQTKLDRAALESDEFKALVIQAVEAASRSASNLRRQALAQALANSVIFPTSQIKNKQTLLRIMSQMSEEEMLVLTALNEGKDAIGEESIGLRLVEVAELRHWSEEETLLACQGLLQLGLVHPPPFDNEVFHLQNHLDRHWRISVLGGNLIQWCSE